MIKIKSPRKAPHLATLLASLTAVTIITILYISPKEKSYLQPATEKPTATKALSTIHLMPVYMRTLG